MGCGPAVTLVCNWLGGMIKQRPFELNGREMFLWAEAMAKTYATSNWRTSLLQLPDRDIERGYSDPGDIRRQPGRPVCLHPHPGRPAITHALSIAQLRDRNLF